MTLLWIPALVGGLGIALFSSRQTLDSAVSLAHKLGLLLLLSRPTHGRGSGAVLIGLYAAAYAVVVA